MKVLQITRANEIKIIETEKPQPKRGEALLKVNYCGICGADILSFTGNQPFTTYPRIPGHEFSATIEEIEENDKGLKKGMTVTANPYFNCGQCYSCRRGYLNCCENNQTMGVQRDGSFSEYITMPIERIYDGNGLSTKELALIEPFSISWHAVKRGDVQGGDNILVVGAGPIGIFSVISAKLRGAKVYITDILDERLELATKMGADGIFNNKNGNLSEFTSEIAKGARFDVCIEACGLPQTFLSCINEVAFAGKVILIGNGKTETLFNHSILLKKELNVYGSRNSLHDFETLIELVKNNGINLMNMVSNIYDFENSADAFKALACNNGSLTKVLIKM